MSTSKTKTKINNSYESEPSSGSGSSISDQNDCMEPDDEIMNFPYLLKPPPAFESEEVPTAPTVVKVVPVALIKSASLQDIEDCIATDKLNCSEISEFEGFREHSFTELKPVSKPYFQRFIEYSPQVTFFDDDGSAASTLHSTNASFKSNYPKRTWSEASIPMDEDEFDKPAPVAMAKERIHSSEVSPFHGFTEIPFDKLKQLMYGEAKTAVQTAIISFEPDLLLPTTKSVHVSYYDTVVAEDSCNAVDIPLSNEDGKLNQLCIEKENDADTGTAQAQDSKSLSHDLSFNGKINSLHAKKLISAEVSEDNQPRSPYNDTENVENTLDLTNLNESFMLRKYKNTRSPDLFADEESEDVPNDEAAENENITAQFQASDEIEKSDEIIEQCSTTTNNGNTTAATIESSKNFPSASPKDNSLSAALKATVPPATLKAITPPATLKAATPPATLKAATPPVAPKSRSPRKLLKVRTPLVAPKSRSPKAGIPPAALKATLPLGALKAKSSPATLKDTTPPAALKTTSAPKSRALHEALKVRTPPVAPKAKSPPTLFEATMTRVATKEKSPKAALKAKSSKAALKAKSPLAVKIETSRIFSSSQSMFRENVRRERELLRRTRQCLAGVPPPPLLTHVQMDIIQAVLNEKTKLYNCFAELNEDMMTDSADSLFKPTHTLEDTQSLTWDEVLSVRQHGLCYNITKASERHEYMSLAVIERFIGSETASSFCNKSPTSTEKRTARLKMLQQSPGNRLSHLATRRAIFSSANLATNSRKSTSLLGPQILIDKRKTQNRRKATPKRVQSGSNKKRKTPSSSGSKRLPRGDLSKTGATRETSKRALFQSPAVEVRKLNLPAKPYLKPEIATRVEKSKRALFSPEQPSFSQNQITNKWETFFKRKRSDLDEDDDSNELCSQHSKLFRSSAENLTPRALKIKSQSFCNGAGSSLARTIPISANSMMKPAMNSNLLSMHGSQFGSNSSLCGKTMQRASSDVLHNQSTTSLTDNQKKKLLWAVSQALQERKITVKHDSFKNYASVLARVVRRIFQEYYQKSSTSNSETLLRLAKKYVYNVIAGRGADEIYIQAKAHIEAGKQQSSQRLSGYIGPEEYEQRMIALHNASQLTQRSLSQSFFSMDTSLDSTGFGMAITQASSSVCSETMPQHSLLTQLTQESLFGTQHSKIGLSPSKSAAKLSNQPSSILHNSSSKNNLSCVALRENVDGEQRRSAQKNFTGIDKKNVSPYSSPGTTSTHSRLGGSGLKLNIINPELSAKAKRQITFDNF